jgi:signal transduction histidine kinase
MSLRGLRFQNLPLFAKLLVPFLTLMVFVGAFGVFLIVRDLGSRAEAALDQDLARRSLDARSVLRDRELYLLESVNFAANLEGVATAVRTNDTATSGRLLQSVLALKSDLSLAVVTDREGVSLAEFTRAGLGEPAQRTDGTSWSTDALITRVLAAEQGAKSSGFLTAGARTVFAMAAPICSAPGRCDSVGAAIVGIDVDLVADAARGKHGSGSTDRHGVAIYDASGRLLERSGPTATEDRLPDGARRRTHEVNGTELATLYTPFDIQSMRAGTLAVSVPTEPAFATVRGAGVRLALILLAAMLGVVAIGWALSRRILGQVGPLVETNRALGRGELDARVPVLSADELGELAVGVNQMAEQLQASYETLELRVAQRTEEIQRLLKERTEFFAALSHELRTPLAVIRGQAKMMLDPSYPKGAKWVTETGAVIDGSAAQLLSLVNDVLELARAEAGRMEIDVERLELSDMLDELRPMLDGLTRSSGLTMNVSIPRNLPAVRADRTRLREVIINLVDNAAKYTPQGGRVDVSAAARNGSLVVSVSDTGVGIPAESRELIFEPFYRVRGTKPQHGQASTGLGLALAKRVVEAQGGTIAVESAPGAGTTFTFTVPLADTPGRRRRAARSVRATRAART